MFTINISDVAVEGYTNPDIVMEGLGSKLAEKATNIFHKIGKVLKHCGALIKEKVLALLQKIRSLLKRDVRVSTEIYSAFVKIPSVVDPSFAKIVQRINQFANLLKTKKDGDAFPIQGDKFWDEYDNTIVKERRVANDLEDSIKKIFSSDPGKDSVTIKASDVDRMITYISAMYKKIDELANKFSYSDKSAPFFLGKIETEDDAHEWGIYMNGLNVSVACLSSLCIYIHSFCIQLIRRVSHKRYNPIREDQNEFINKDMNRKKKYF